MSTKAAFCRNGARGSGEGRNRFERIAGDCAGDDAQGERCRVREHRGVRHGLQMVCEQRQGRPGQYGQAVVRECGHDVHYSGYRRVAD